MLVFSLLVSDSLNDLKISVASPWNVMHEFSYDDFTQTGQDLTIVL